MTGEGAHILAATADDTGEIVGTLRTAAHKEHLLADSLFHKLSAPTRCPARAPSWWTRRGGAARGRDPGPSAIA